MSATSQKGFGARHAVCAALVLVLAGFAPLVHAGTSAPIFAYFQIGRDEQPDDNLRIEQFQSQVELLSQDYTVVPVSRIVEAFETGKPLPDNAVGLTFDDAYRSVADNALPALKKAGLTATLFVSPRLVDKGGDYMSWAELRRAMRDGFTIGAKIDLDDIGDDSSTRTLGAVNESLSRLRDQLGVAPTLFAYADGIATKPMRQIVESRGFKAGFGLQSGPASAASDRYALPRFSMTEAFGDIDRFTTAADSLPLAVRDVLPEDQSVHAGNPPRIGFTVDQPDADLAKLACFVEDQGKAPLQVLGDRVEIRPAAPFEVDDTTRVNCTLPASGDDAGRWRWLGFNFYVPPG